MNKKLSTGRKKSAKKKHISSLKSIAFNAMRFKQGKHYLYLFSAPVSMLWSILEINQRSEEKDEGYQRVLSPSRVSQISRFVDTGKPLAPAILVAFDAAEWDERTSTLQVPNTKGAGWVIDGQHRLAGAHEASSDISIAVVAFIGLDLHSQIEQFVIVNREAKGVPSSLYYDLLKHLPTKKPADAAKEIAADIANELKIDPESPFFGKIVVTSSPKKGELSLTNFVRKIAPLINSEKGELKAYTQFEQAKIISNYFSALRNVFPSEFMGLKQIFFATLGFGAAINALPLIFSYSIREHHAFDVASVSKILMDISDFDFDRWKQLGTGNAAEIEAGRDIEADLRRRRDQQGSPSAIKL